MERVMEALKSMDIRYIYGIVGIVVVLVVLFLIWVLFLRKRMCGNKCRVRLDY